MEPQKASNWCWAAVSKSVSMFYNAGSTWTQCLVAKQTLGMANCCDANIPTACNVAHNLTDPLTVVGNFNLTTTSETMAHVQSEINDGHPMGVRVEWANHSGHFVIIDGYDTESDSFSVRDPIYGTSIVSRNDLISGHYKGDGTWTDSYYTQS